MTRARVEQLAARVRLALVVVEEDARAAVQLGDDDALGAVDDERAGVGHQRDLAEVDLLLLDVAHDALAAVAGVVDHELRRHLDRRRERHAALAALIDVVLRLLEVVRDEDELARAVEVLDREDAAEHRLEADLRALARRDVRSAGTCRTLDFWMSMRLGTSMIAPHAAEVLADAEVGLDRRRHRVAPPTNERARRARRLERTSAHRRALASLARENSAWRSAETRETRRRPPSAGRRESRVSRESLTATT